MMQYKLSLLAVTIVTTHINSLDFTVIMVATHIHSLVLTVTMVNTHNYT